MSAIELQGVSKHYGGLTAVDDLSFRIEEGERVVLHGPSGCGKTTVLRLIAGFLAPDIGKVFVGGKEVASEGAVLSGPEHRHLGMVFQDLALWPHLTVAQNLDFALKAQRMPGDIRRQRIAGMLARVHLDGSAEAYPAKLSGGQQQRAAIARALVAHPLAVPMDEPLSNLDDELRDELRGQILDLHAQLGFTLIYVTHSKQEVSRIGTRSIQMRDGKAKQSGGVEGLVPGTYGRKD